MSEHTKEQDPRERLLQMLPDIRVIQMIYVASKLNIADLLSKGSVNVEDLAIASKVHAPTLYRLLRAGDNQAAISDVERFGRYAASNLRYQIPH